MFCNYTKFITGELDHVDPDLTGGVKPPGMTDAQWRRFQADLAAAASRGGGDKDADAQMLSVEERLLRLDEHVSEWEKSFGRHLQILLDALNHYAATETVVLLSLCARLSTVNSGTEYTGLRVDDVTKANRAG